MTNLSQDLQERAATLVESAYEAGYDAAAEVAYNAGYEDGKEQGQREGFEEALDVIRTTQEAFSDPGDACDCPFCAAEDDPELYGDPLAEIANLPLDMFSPLDDEPCNCVECKRERGETINLLLSGDYTEDSDTIIEAINFAGENDDILSEAVGQLDDDLQRLVDKLNAWGPTVDENITEILNLTDMNAQAGIALVRYVEGLEQRINDLEDEAELAEADAVVLEALSARLSAVESRLGGELLD